MPNVRIDRRSVRIDRRSFLRGTGVALTLPMLDIMRPVAQAASTATPPTRMLCVFQPNGVYPKAWDVDGSGADFRFSPILEPLKHLKDDLLVVSNLDNKARGHVQMTSAFLTGHGVNGGTCAVSMDQVLARKTGQNTPLPSIHLGTEPPRQGGDGSKPISFANTISWNSPTTRVSPEINPRVAFDRLFRDQTSDEAKAEAADRRSVLDLVLEDARALRRKASTADQRKLDEYLESVRSVEVRIDKALNPPQRSWTPPTKPELVRPAPGIPRQRNEHLRIMME